MVGCFACGTTAPGSMPLAVDVPFQVSVGGVLATKLQDPGGVSIDDSLAARSTCTLRIRDDALALSFQPGDPVFVSYHGARLFGGTVDEVVEEVLATRKTAVSRGKVHDLSCVDFTQLLDRYYVAAVYENLTVLQIVTDIVNVQTLLATEGITLGEVEAGPVITKVSFNYRRVADCFRELAELTGMQWTVDAHKAIRFFDKASHTAPFSFTATSRPDRRVRYRRSRDQYRNVQIIRAGFDRTSQQEETFRGDSTTVEPADRRRTFNLKFEVAEMVEIAKDTGGDGNFVVQRVGVRGKDPDGDITLPSPSTWPQWFYGVGSTEISQNSDKDETNNPTLAENDILRVRYIGRFPLIGQARNESEVSNRALIEGGAGVYEHIEDDQELDGHDFAEEKMTRLLAMYGRIPKEIDLETDTPGLAPGHLQTNAFAEHGLTSAQYLIDQVQIEVLKYEPITLRVQVHMLDGERIDGWTDFFVKLFQAGRKFVVRENEVVALLREPKSEQLKFTDALTDPVASGDQTGAYETDPYSFALMGEVEVVGGDPLVGRAVSGRSISGRPHGV